MSSAFDRNDVICLSLGAAVAASALTYIAMNGCDNNNKKKKTTAAAAAKEKGRGEVG